LTTTTPQLPLALAGDPARLETFEAGANAAALRAVAALATEPRGCITLWGPPGTGKTHLLRGAITAAREAGAVDASLLLGGADLGGLPERLAGDRLEQYRLLALDIAGGDWGDWGERAFEEAVFRACHRARGGELGLLIALPAHPEQAGIALADLRSRLLGGDCFRLAPPDEATRRRILAGRAVAAGLELGDEALDYLLARLPRDLHSLCGFIDRMDSASLAEQRRPTVPFLRSLIEWSDLDPRLPL
jgi:DnaA-homolog protein